MRIITSCLVLLLPVLTESAYGRVYERGRSILKHVILMSSDVQDGRIFCNVTDIFGGFNASACALPLSDIKTINEIHQRHMTTMCFGVYDLVYEVCSRANQTANRTVPNVDISHIQNYSDFCVETSKTRLLPIEHTDHFLNMWSEYLIKQLMEKESCEELCQFHDGAVHLMCKLILAGYRFLNLTSDESSTKRSGGKHIEIPREGVPSFGLWFTVVMIVVLLTTIAAAVHFTGKKFQVTRRVFSTRPHSRSNTRLYEIENATTKT